MHVKWLAIVSRGKSLMNLNCSPYCYRVSSQSRPEPKYAVGLKLFLQEALGKLLNSEVVRRNSQAGLLLSNARKSEFAVAFQKRCK